MAETAWAGQTVLVRGAGFTPGAGVEVWLYSDPILLGRAIVSADGAIEVPVVLPPEIVGTHRLLVFEPGTGIAARQNVVISSQLPRTGGTPWRTAAMAAGTFVCGFALITLVRRPRPRL
jgi:5'-nucleotidase